MEIVVAYLVGVVVLQGLFAIRAPYEQALTVYGICLCWPVSIVLIVLMFLIQAVNWDFDVAASTKRFGYRKPSNPNARGFAVILFNTEFQFYTTKKA
jgi:glucan phosphoethanolaminetransferase (alkaline phosphatase superfamily)